MIGRHTRSTRTDTLVPYTTPVRSSGAGYGRVCRVSMGYQSLDDELAIVVHEAKSAGATEAAGDEDFVRRVVSVVRGTREHPDVRIGSDRKSTRLNSSH